jgi:hypothetical protein
MHRIIVPALLALAGATALAQHAPYAGQQARSIKSLSATEVAELQAGQGMGLAKAAELNGYPGPAHVLELADALHLKPAQRDASRALMTRHKQRATELGLALLEAEQALDRAFAGRTIDAGALDRMMADIGQRQAQLRQEHLRTHLEQTALLDAHQIHRYNELRGYTGAPGGAGHGHHGGHRP